MILSRFGQLISNSQPLESEHVKIAAEGHPEFL
jgi:hypothetical protein